MQQYFQYKNILFLCNINNMCFYFSNYLKFMPV